MFEDDDPRWAARMRMTAQEMEALRRKAAQETRDAYDATTRAMAKAGEAAQGWLGAADEAGDKFKAGVRARLDGLARDARSTLARTAPGQVAGAAGALGSNYFAMLQANWKDDDKYFHCKGNCEASQIGPIGELTAMHLANGREIYGQRVKHDPLADELADQGANRLGRFRGRSEPQKSCRQLCSAYRPAGLPEKY